MTLTSFFPHTIICGVTSLLLASAGAAPFLHWKLDETSGAVAADASGNGRDATYFQGLSETAEPSWLPEGGVAGGAVNFANIDDEVLRSSEEIFSDTDVPFTISIWVNTVSSSNDTVATLSDGSGNVYYTVQVVGGQARLTARSGASDQLNSGVAVNDGEWHHIVATFVSLSERRIYVDGFLEGEDFDEVFGPLPFRFSIGALDRNAVNDEYDGLIDDVTLYTEVLDEVTIGALFSIGKISGGDATLLDPFIEAFNTQSDITIGTVTWRYNADIGGDPGEVGGDLAFGDAFVVLDEFGAGMEITEAPETPFILSFSASPISIIAGDETTLSWDILNASTIIINPGEISVDDDIGSIALSPTETTTYTITATNTSGEDIETADVTVNPVPEPAEIVLHWPLDEGSGSVTVDTVSGNNGLFITDTANPDNIAPEWSADGFLGSAVDFFGVSGNAIRTEASLVTDYPFSISGWVLPASIGNQTFAVLATGANGQYYSLRVNAGSARLTARNGGESNINGTNVNDGEWHHITGVYITEGFRRLYVDGVQVGEDISNTSAFVAPNRFSIGALDRSATSTVDPFSGLVDDAAVWDSALTPDEIFIIDSAARDISLNAGNVGALFSGFRSQEDANTAGFIWSFSTGLTGEIGTSTGTVDGGDATLVMDDEGNGMAITAVAPEPVFFSITNITFDSDARSVSLTWESEEGIGYGIEVSDELAVWTTLVENVTGSTSQTTAVVDTEIPDTITRRFYRVVVNSSE